MVQEKTPVNEPCPFFGDRYAKLNGYKRMKKEDYLKAYAECAKITGKAKG
jgi:hypothetical protein